MNKRFLDTSPIYQQIIDAVKTDIAAGRYKSRQKLPAVRDMAVEFGVNPNTVQRAFAELERQGLVQSERTSGRFLNIDEQGMEKLREDLCRGYLKQMYTQMKDLGLDRKQIRELIERWEEEDGDIEM